MLIGRSKARKDSLLSSVTFYTGNATIRNISTGGRVDLLITKSKDATASNYLWDSTRGAGKRLLTDQSDFEQTDANGVTALNSKGFSLGTSGTANSNTIDYAAFSWAKASEYLDIVTFTGTGSSHTESHSLGTVPTMMWLKNRDSGTDWSVYHKDLDSTAPEDYSLKLNDNSSRANSATEWNDTAPTSSVFTVGTGTGVNGNTDEIIAYLFADKTGLSKSGSYSGTSPIDPTINLGFRPSAVIVKQYNSTKNWFLYYDDGGTIKSVYLNEDSVPIDESSNISFTSTGFSITDGLNNNTGDYIYFAWK